MYAQPIDVRAVLSRDANTGDFDTPAHYADDQLSDAIKRADARIDLHLRSRYTVPVAVPDDLLRDYSSVLAAYYVTLTQSNNQDVEGNDPIRLRAQEVMAELKEILAGIILLPYPLEEDDSADVLVVNKYEGDMFLLEEFITPTIYNLPTHGCNCSCYNGTRCSCA